MSSFVCERCRRGCMTSFPCEICHKSVCKECITRDNDGKQICRDCAKN